MGRSAGCLIGHLAMLGVAALLTACQPKPATDVPGFLARHWADPVAAQGSPPAGYGEVEASLAPEACGTCHAEQFADWRQAQHSRSMGNGIRWQFGLLQQEEANKCLRCHAPLAEQKALLAMRYGWPNAPRTPPPAYVSEQLADSGLVCAACHVRGHRRFGPGKKPRLEGQPHGGFEAAPAFADSRFCAACHQFPPEGARLAGKLREDTYAQWSASPFAGRQSCQDCHMPDGRHLWRGIHDPEMLRKALAVDLRLDRSRTNEYVAAVVARNVGAGHHLPTYMVPKIDLVLRLLRPGEAPQEIARDVIGWKADVEMTREAFDTRLPAGGRRDFAHAFRPPARGGWTVELSVEVAPREHYERMFAHYRRTLALDEKTKTLLDAAIAEAAAARYVALRKTIAP